MKNKKQQKNKRILIVLSITVVLIFLAAAGWVFIKTESMLPNNPPIVIFSPGKLQTTNWKIYDSRNLGIIVKYPTNWQVNEFSQDNGYSYILDFDSPDVKSINTNEGGGIEISIYFDDIKDRLHSTLSAEQYIKKKMHVMPPFVETVFKNGYHAIKFRNPERKNDKGGSSYFEIPYKDKILDINIRFTNLNRRQEAEDVADSMINSLIIDSK